MLIIGGVVAAFGVFNSVYPAVERSGQAVSEAADAVNDRLTTQVRIIQVGESGLAVDAWVKNIGSSLIGGVDGSDLFLGLDGSVSRIPFGDNTSALPYWTYQLEGGNAQWGQATTNKITIHLSDALTPGIYLLKMVIPNGVSDETSFSVE